MKLRQSDIKTWQTCPLKWRYQHIDGLDREQSGSLTFGSILHDCVLFLELTQDVEAAVARFRDQWSDPAAIDPEYEIDYYVRGTNWKKYLELGEKVIRNWWTIISWDSDVTLAREYHFEVPIGNGHTLEGTLDKLALRYVPSINQRVVLISDYKTNNKVPTYDYLAEDLQFSAYCYATTRPEFWANIPGGRGPTLYTETQDLPRHSEWVHLVTPRRMDAGERTQRHYDRLAMQVNAMAESIAMRIFTLNISGESCRYCDFRKQCGLPELETAK